MHEDIDWLNASSDFGLILLCREMAALARPVEKLAQLATARPRTSSRRRATPAVARVGALAPRVFGA